MTLKGRMTLLQNAFVQRSCFCLFYLLRDIGIKVSVVSAMMPVMRLSPTLDKLAANKKMTIFNSNSINNIINYMYLPTEDSQISMKYLFL